MYRYEMHAHTMQTSKCGHIDAADLVDFYKSIGYAGIVITDHFLNGNTVVPKDLPWNERIDLFCIGYEKAKARGDEIGLPVFFGWEFNHCGSEFLTYGLDKNWLLEHEDCDKLTAIDYFDLVHESGGFITHAHPFHEASYISTIRLYPRKVDAVEVLNTSKPDLANTMAKLYAEKYGILEMAGSDNHCGPRALLSSLSFEEKQEDLQMLLDSVRNKKHFIERLTFEV